MGLSQEQVAQELYLIPSYIQHIDNDEIEKIDKQAFVRGYLRSYAKLVNLDGDDIINHVVSKRRNYSRTLFWRGKRGNRTWAAVRHNDQKYVRKIEADEQEEWMFDLSKDKVEESSLIPMADPGHLKSLLHVWEEEMKAAKSRP